MNNNPFMNNQNKMPPFMKMAPMRTPTIIKWIIVIIFGVLPFLLMYIFVGTTDISGWHDSSYTNISYGAMWGAAIATYLLSVMATSFVAYFSKDVKNDVVPITSGFSMMCLGFYIMPLIGYWSLFFIIIAPILFILGFVFGAIGVLIVQLRKIGKEMQNVQTDPELQKQFNEMMNQMNGGKPMPGQMPPQQKPKDKKESYKDNPYVDVEPDEDEEK